jgi:hypothetical protein
MMLVDPARIATLMPIFACWLRDRADAINLHPKGPQFLMPPPWYG